MMKEMIATMATMAATNGLMIEHVTPTGRHKLGTTDDFMLHDAAYFEVRTKQSIDMETTLANVDYAEVEHRIINQMDRRQSEMVAEMLGPSRYNYFDDFFGAPPTITDPDHWNPVFRETRQLQATVEDLVGKSHGPKKSKRAKRRA